MIAELRSWGELVYAAAAALACMRFGYQMWLTYFAKRGGSDSNVNSLYSVFSGGFSLTFSLFIIQFLYQLSNAI